MFRDCYASFDKANSRIIIGNSRIEKVIHIKGSFLRTEKIRDIQNNRTWEGNVSCWQRCPVLEPNEQPELNFDSNIMEKSWGMKPHLKTTLEFIGKNGNVWCEFIVFPDIPFVFQQFFADWKESVNIGESEKKNLLVSGIETVIEKRDADTIYCTPDTLDCIPLGNCHLEMENIILYDKTDINDCLLERQTIPVYKRGRQEREGNIFRLSDYVCDDSLILMKHSPTPSSAINRQSKDLILSGNRYVKLMGTGVDFSSLPSGKVPYYASAVGVAKTNDWQEELWRYHSAITWRNPEDSLFIMSNTWGDRNSDKKVCEEFVLHEIELAHKIGINIVQIDDGWQKGKTSNSVIPGGVWEGFYGYHSDFWSADPRRFPNGLDPVVSKAKEYGIEIGLWFGPDSSNDFENEAKDIETLWSLYQRYGIRYFKLDGVKIRSKKGEMRFIHLLEELTERSGGDIRFNMDVTAEDRFGYMYQTRYGCLFVENRYTDWTNYFPHNTFRNLWSLAAVLPTRRLQMELLNNRRNEDKYEGLKFAPSQYEIDYLFASVMPANPLAWMELSGLVPEDVTLLSRIIAVYKQHAKELCRSRVIPVGDQPNGMAFSGYLCLQEDKKTGYLILFREETEKDTYSFALPVSLKERRISVLYQDNPVQFSCEAEKISVKFSKQRSFIWLSFS